MHQSVAATADVLPPSSSSPSTATDVRNSGSINNGRSSSLLMGGGESGTKGTGLLPKSSSSSPPKSQDVSNPVNLYNPPQNGTAQAQAQPPPKAHHAQESTSGDNNPSHGGGDVFLQWGQRKRSKRTVGDKFSGGHAMPPSGSSRGGGACGGAKLRPASNGVFCSKDASTSRNRNLEESRMGGVGVGGGGSPSSKTHNGGRSISRSTVGKRSHSVAEKTDCKKNSPCSSSFGGGSIRKDRSSDSLEQPNGSHYTASPARGGGGTVVVAVAAETEAAAHNKSSGPEVEWPRIYIALSRKEKEEDFFTMKGTKLPHRPKKRAKAIDRTLQYCFPGMWLSDLTKARYEVRERKGVKKPRRRGLKGLENMESDSD